jgi:hypothetical protein
LCCRFLDRTQVDKYRKPPEAFSVVLKGKNDLSDSYFFHSAKMPKEGDEGLSDTVKQLSLLLGSYSLKLADFVKEKDAEGRYSQKLLASVKDGTPYIHIYYLS